MSILRLLPPLFILIFLSLSIAVYGQYTPEDSIEFLQLTKKFAKVRKINLDSSLTYLDTLRDFAERTHYTRGAISAQFYRSAHYSMKGDRERSIEEGLLALQLTETYQQFKAKPFILRMLSTQHRVLGNYEQAKTYLEEALSAAETNQDTVGMYYAIGGLAVLHEVLDDYKTSAKYYYKELDYYTSIGDTDLIIRTLINMSILHKESGNFSRALEMLRESEALIKRSAAKDRYSHLYSNYGALYANIHQLDSALHYFELSEAIVARDGKDQIRSTALYNIAKIKVEQEEYRQALLWLDTLSILDNYPRYKINLVRSNALLGLGKKEESLVALEQSIEQFPDKEELTTFYDLELTKGKVYAASKNYPNALLAYERAITLQDSIIAKRQAASINLAEAKYNNKALQGTVALQGSQLKIKNIFLWAIGAGLLFLGLIAYLFYSKHANSKRFNEELKVKNKTIEVLHSEAQHRAQNQLELAIELLNDTREAAAQTSNPEALIVECEMKLRALASVNEVLMSHEAMGGQQLTTILTEIITGNFFSLFEGKGEFDLQIQEVDFRPNKITPIALIINELSINSIKHAFFGIAHPKITVTGTVENNTYVLTYRDNGKGEVLGIKAGNGLSLIEGLSGQIGGNISCQLANGFIATLKIPMNNENSNR